MVTIIKDADGNISEGPDATHARDPSRTRGTQRTERREVPGILRSMSRLGSRNTRSKPMYSDCWLIGTDRELETIESYRVPGASVVIGTASDGQTEYNLTPDEYRFDEITGGMMSDMIADLRDRFINGSIEPNRYNMTSHATAWLIGRTDHIEKMCEGDLGRTGPMLDRMSDTAYRHTMGLGIFDVLLSDQRIEDIYIDAPCERNRIHVTLNGVRGFNSHLRCRTNLTVDRREVQNLISSLKRDSGLPFCETSPVLETDISGHDARATVVGYPMSPLGDAVAIRKHSMRPWTLTRLISNGTMDADTAGLLSFMVNMRSTFLISGARGAGKSSLLSALMFEFPLSQRILTIEDTMELPCDKMRRMGYKVQSMLIDERMEGDALKRSDEALRVSLRLGESAIILGEVRGSEARTLYQSMRAGKAGSSIMGTIHGDSAKSVYERVVHDMNIAPEAFMATDMIVTVGTRRSKNGSDSVRRVAEIVSTSDRHGKFIPAFSDGRLSDDFLSSPVMRRIMSDAGMSKDDVVSEVRVRAGIRSYLASVDGGKGCGPEWIPMSNDFLSKEERTDGDADRTVNAFRQWFGRYNGLS